MNRDQCCNHDCRQGRACPRRSERRTQASLLRRLFGWIISERRKTLDRRARVDMGGLPNIVFMSGASSWAETEAGNRRWLSLNAELDFEPAEHHKIADMANVGYQLMKVIKALRPDYSWSDSPTEIVSDLINEIDELNRVAEDVHNRALEEAAKACLSAVPDRARVKALGESGHYSTCAAIVRALKRTSTCEASNG